MCRSCVYPQPSTRTNGGVGWAVPVDITRLGPHLEAYLEAKPALDTLRLCHRFGSGPKVHITKLPLELIAMIEKEIQTASRLRNAVVWNQDYLCFQGCCDLEDHFNEADMNKLVEEAEAQLSYVDHKHKCKRDGRCKCARVSYAYEEDDDTLMDLVGEMMVESETRLETHYERSISWECRTNEQCISSFPNPVQKFQKVLETDFGLSTVICHQRIKIQDVYLTLRNYNDSNAPKETLCFLTLPGAVLTEEFGHVDLLSGHDGKIIEAYNVFSTVIDPRSLDITDTQRLRFGRAMKLLDLKPCFHFSQVRGNVPTGLSLEETEELKTTGARCAHHQGEQHERARKDMAKRVEKLEKSAWPKLMAIGASSFVMDLG